MKENNEGGDLENLSSILVTPSILIAQQDFGSEDDESQHSNILDEVIQEEGNEWDSSLL